MRQFTNIYGRLISSEHLFSAWDAFRRDKRNKADVQRFEWNLEEHIFRLHRELRSKTYEHGSYSGFYIHDPKQRHIHKATVRDRIVHHAIHSILNPIFEPTFIPTSFSCRIGYGTHRGVMALGRMVRSVSRNSTRPCFVLKCDIRKFFDSIDHAILVGIIKKRIADPDALWLVEKIVSSYSVTRERERERERDDQTRAKRRTHREPYFAALCQCLHERV